MQAIGRDIPLGYSCRRSLASGSVTLLVGDTPSPGKIRSAILRTCLTARLPAPGTALAFFPAVRLRATGETRSADFARYRGARRLPKANKFTCRHGALLAAREKKAHTGRMPAWVSIVSVPFPAPSFPPVPGRTLLRFYPHSHGRSDNRPYPAWPFCIPHNTPFSPPAALHIPR